MRIAFHIWIVLAALCLLVSCDSNIVYERNTDIPDEAWHRDSILTYNVPISDTLGVYDIVFNNRITGQYQYSNMFVFITIVAPDHAHYTDTLECLLADTRGKWLGRGFGNIWSNKLYYKRNIAFPRKGNYTFYIEQAMRVESLPHVLDAGLQIVKVN